ncbi:MAG: oligosaccharide flippase family protein [Bacteroidaceae bacterium]|nr:oligosaccharide flippase family protein [Bacteroidaceae bacterium]
MKGENSGKSALNHVLKYTGVFGGVQGLNILMSIVRTKLTSYLLGPIGFALMGVYVSVSEFVSSTSNLGVPFASVRHLSEVFARGDSREVGHWVLVIRTWCFWISLFAALLCVAGAHWLGQWFGKDTEVSAWSITLLTPMVMALAITAGEISILKAIRRLKRVATISVLAALSTLCLTVPLFWAFGTRGIILALDVSTMAVTCIHLAFTTPLHPWRIAPFSRAVLQDGWQLVRVGLPYAFAAIAGSGVAMALPALMIHYGTLEDVGFYRVGYGLMVTYAGIVFTAFEADFFPRLSAVNQDTQQRNQTINQQARVCLLLISPMLIALVTAMPLVIRLLNTTAFLPATGMAVCAAFYMFLRSVTVPMGYTALACGDSAMFLLMEVIYDVVSLGLIFGGYLLLGLTGAGIGLSLSALFDLMLIGLVYGHFYHVRLSASTLRLAAAQGLLLAVTVVACMLLPGFWRAAVGILLLVLSTAYSYRILASETTLIQSLKQKIQKRLRLNS